MRISREIAELKLRVLIGKFTRVISSSIVHCTVLLDLCKEANCHENGHCVLRDEIKFANCSCDEGYRGNGTFCTGVVELSNTYHT